MHRLRCGVIYTNAFADYLSRLPPPVGQSPSQTPSRVLALDYVSTGKGKAAWWQMDWLPAHQAEETNRFKIGDVLVFLSKQCQRGLKHRCLDWRDGQVVVRS